MRKISVLLISALLSFAAWASHVPGGNLTYQCLGNNQFLVTLTIYEDQGTGFITSGSTQSITITNDCGLANPNLILNDVSPPDNDVSQLCPTATPGVGIPGNDAWTYSNVVTLPAGCDSWHFAYSSCCRDASTNLTGTGSNYYFSADLNNLDAPCNSSPTFSAPPIPYACVGQSFCYSLGVVETDGDSLVYSFVAPATSATGTVPYNTGYSAANPYPGLSIDPNTGQVTGVLATQGSFVVAIQIEEYDDNGVLIGVVVHDFTIEILNCNNQVIDCATSGVIGGVVGSVAQTGPTELEMCEGVPFSFDMSFTDPDMMDSLFINSNITSVLPGAVVSYTYPNAPNGNEIIMTVSWTPPPGSSNSNNVFSVTVLDNACPVSGQQTLVYNMNVLGSTNAAGSIVGSAGSTGGPGSDPENVIICLGQEVQFNVENGTVFDWTVISGDPMVVGTNFSCTPCSSPIASPVVTTVYEVVSDLVGSCVSRDTVTVTVVPNFTYSLTQSSTTSCLNSDIQLEVNPFGGGNYAYTWSPATFLSGTTIANPLVTPTTPGPLEYAVEIVSQDGCVKNDTVDLTVAAAYSPDVTVTTNLNSIMCGDTIFFTADLGGGVPASCGPSVNNTCASPATVTNIGTGTTNISSSPTPFIGLWEDGRIQMIYLASELNAAGFVGGKITELGFNVVSKNSYEPYKSLTFKMGCTSATSLSVATNFLPNLSVVHSVGSYNTFAGWNTFVLNTAYEWDGIENIIVEICYDNDDWTSTDRVAQTATANDMTLYDYADGVSGCTLNSPIVSKNRPNLRFKSCPTIPDPANYSWEWTPTGAGLSSVTAQNPYALPQVTTDFQLVVTDLNGGCTDTVITTIDVLCDTCQAPIPVLTDVTCFGGSDGQVVATPYGIEGPPFDVRLLEAGTLNMLQQDANVLVSTTFSGLSAGNYIVRSYDTTGCWADTLITINQPPIMTLSTTADTIVCIGGTAVMTATAGGGNPGGYTYNWTGLAGTTSTQNTSPTAVTSYDVYALDPQGCSTDTLTINVNMYPPILTSVGLTDTVCPGFSGIVSVQANGGFGGNYSYSWSDEFGNVVGNQNIANVTPVASPATYYVEVTDGCETPAKLDSLNVYWYNVPQPSFTADVVNGCYPVAVNFTNTTDPTFVDQCYWDYGNGLTSAACAAQNTVYNTVGSFDVSLTVTSADGCVGDTTYVGMIEAYGYPVADFGIFPNPINVLAPTTTMYDSSSSDVTSFEWNFGEMGLLGNSTVQNPEFTFPDYEPENFDVELIVLNQYGCSDTIVKVVIMNGVYNFYVPTGFTPNGDGINDFFYPQGEGVDELEYEMIIFDRWGSIVFETTDLTKTWDGNKLGVPAPEGVYVWKVITKDKYKGTEFENIGNVTIVR